MSDKDNPITMLLPERRQAYEDLSVALLQYPGDSSTLRQLRTLRDDELISVARSEAAIAKGKGKPAWLAGQTTNLKRRQASVKILDEAIEAGEAGQWTAVAKLLSDMGKATAPTSTQSKGQALPNEVISYLQWLAENDKDYQQWKQSQRLGLVETLKPEIAQEPEPPKLPSRCAESLCNHPEHL